MNAILQAAGLGKRYGRRWALRDCTLAIPAGQVVGLVGPNGAGKTTLLNLAVSRICIAGEVSELLASHHQLSGPRRDSGTLPADQEVITESHTDRQSTLLIRTRAPILDPAWTVRPVSLEDLVLAYMSRTGGAVPARPALGVVS